MAERSLTLLEIHLGDGDVRIGPNALLGGTDADAIEGDADAGDNETSGSDASGGRRRGTSIGIALLAVGLVTIAGFVAARLLGEDGPEDALELDSLAE